MSGPSNVEINSVTLNHGHIRITLGPTEDDPPFQLYDLPLFGNGGAVNGSTHPATIPMTGAKLTVNLTFTNNQYFLFEIKALVQGVVIATSQQSPVSATVTGSIDVELATTPTVSPWGSGGTIDWHIHIISNGQEVNKITKQTPIQLYAIAGELNPMYTGRGVPQDILTLFIDQPNNTPSSAINSWIQWVVTRCHASTDDPQTSNAIHSYTYNTFCGAPRFSEMRQFDLLGWLKQRNDNSPLVMVNCLDQCSLVICVLSLGLPFYLRDKNNQIVTKGDSSLTTLQRFYKGTDDDTTVDRSKRFGFINTKDLVGWGNCNSPFFSANKANIIVPATGNTPGVERESFKNHYFVCYNTINDSGSVVQNALDACAGPANDPTVTLNSYLTSVIDKDASQESNGTSWDIFGEVTTWDPTDSMNMLTLFTPSIKTKWKGGALWTALVKAQGTRNPSPTPIGATFDNLSSSLGANIQTGKFDVDIGKDRTSIAVEFSNQQSVPFVRATIDVMKDFESAQLQAESRQFYTQRDWDTVFAIPTADQYIGDVNLVTKGELNVALIIYGNVVFYLEGDNGPRDQFDALVQAINSYMVSAMKTAFTPFDSSTVSISMSPSAPVGTSFEINITAPGVEWIEVASETDIVQFTKGPNLVAGGGWSLTCTTYRAGPDRVAFGFAQAGTYYPYTDKVAPFTANPPTTS